MGKVSKIGRRPIWRDGGARVWRAALDSRHGLVGCLRPVAPGHGPATARQPAAAALANGEPTPVCAAARHRRGASQVQAEARPNRHGLRAPFPLGCKFNIESSHLLRSLVSDLCSSAKETTEDHSRNFEKSRQASIGTFNSSMHWKQYMGSA